jgi:hypothetical protein
MPVALERRLKREAIEKGFKTKEQGHTVLSRRGEAYVYGTLRKTGWKPSREMK